jgi:ribosomal-protein-alanine N-acetyltransferase
MTAESTLSRQGYLEDAAAHAANGRFIVRPAGPEDIASLEQLERDAFPEQWPPTRFASEIRKTDALYLIAATSPSAALAGEPPSAGGAAPTELSAPAVSAVESSAPNGRSLASWLDGLARLRASFLRRPGRLPPPSPSYVAGFVGMWFVVDEAHVIAIGVRRFERRRGVGELLLLGAFDAARRRQMSVLTLEVRKSNSGAQALYSKYGFREVGLRKKYYVDNGEDAIIMTTPQISTPDFAERLQRLARGHAERWGRPGVQAAR